jgi:dienelactone hydrolase
MRTLLCVIFVFLNVLGSKSQSLPLNTDLLSDGNILKAKIYPANNGKMSPAVILLHGFPGNNNSPLGLAERLQKSGITILVFNYQGSFASEGLFSFDNCKHDIGVALSFLKQESNIKRFGIDTSRIVICGYSLGGAMALTAATQNPDIKNIISIAGGNDQAIYLTKMVLNPAYRAGFEQRIVSTYAPGGPIKGDSMYIHDYFDRIIPEVDRYDLLKNAEQLKELKVLFMVGWQDNEIPMEEYIIPIYRKLKSQNPEKIYIKAFDTDHTFGNVRDELAKSIVEWVND